MATERRFRLEERHVHWFLEIQDLVITKIRPLVNDQRLSTGLVTDDLRWKNAGYTPSRMRLLMTPKPSSVRDICLNFLPLADISQVLNR